MDSESSDDCRGSGDPAYLPRILSCNRQAALRQESSHRRWTIRIVPRLRGKPERSRRCAKLEGAAGARGFLEALLICNLPSGGAPPIATLAEPYAMSISANATSAKSRPTAGTPPSSRVFMTTRPIRRRARAPGLLSHHIARRAPAAPGGGCAARCGARREGRAGSRARCGNAHPKATSCA